MKNYKTIYKDNFDFELIKGITDEDKLLLCPDLVLKGWWWRKYFKKYRDESEILNSDFRNYWMNGGYEKTILDFKELYNLFMDEIYLHYFPPLSTYGKSLSSRTRNNKVNKNPQNS